MLRVARIVIPGVAHHVTQRGNNRQDVFFVDDDRRTYLELLAQRAETHGLEVLAYCLMVNHVHLVVVPSTESSLAKAIGRTHYHYTQYVNRLYGRSGHLWQNRFFSCPLDEHHKWAAISYVERNPVRARMVRVAWRYPWSSAAARVGEEERSGLLDLAAWTRDWSSAAWQQELRQHHDDQALGLLRARTHTGRPLGSDRFLSKFKTTLGRRLRPLPVSQPRTRDDGEQAASRENR